MFAYEAHACCWKLWIGVNLIHFILYNLDDDDGVSWLIGGGGGGGDDDDEKTFEQELEMRSFAKYKV